MWTSLEPSANMSSGVYFFSIHHWASLRSCLSSSASLTAIIRVMMGVSGFRIVWKFHTVEAIPPSAQQWADNYVSKGLYRAAASDNFQVQNPCWIHGGAVLISATGCSLSAIVCALRSSGSRGAAWLTALYKSFIPVFLLEHHSISDFFLVTLWLGLTVSPNERWDSAARYSDGFSHLSGLFHGGVEIRRGITSHALRTASHRSCCSPNFLASLEL